MANPILERSFSNEYERVIDEFAMTISGTISKSLILLGTILLSSMYTWGLYAKGFTDKAILLGSIGMIIALIAGLVVVFTRSVVSNVLSLVYSVGEGFVLGLISFIFESRYPGIVLTAVLCTFSAMAMMLLLYKIGLIRCTEKFRAVIVTATASVAIIYLIQIVASFFNRGIPQIFTSSPFGIGFSVIVCGIAAFNFIIDFDFIEQGERYKFPKIYEWIGALSLMFSLVWLYLELLRLFAKISSRR